MMRPAIDKPASCEIRTVARSLHAKDMSDAEIYRDLCAAYGQNLMSEVIVRQLCRMFEDGRTNVHDEERSGQPTIYNE
jgi:hypothetical protein